MLQNSFQRISCAAIDAVLYSSEHKFTDTFRFLSNVESQRSAIDGGDDSGQFDGIPTCIKVFIKQKRPKRTATVTDGDELLCGEIDAIPETEHQGE